MNIRPADRLSELQEYYFSKKLKEVAKLNQEGKDIINMGIGSPDLMPDAVVISELIETTIQSQNHGYQAYQGIPELRKALAQFSKAKYNIDLDQNEVLPLIGSKEGITHISFAYLNPGDQVLIPELGYPTYTSVTKMVGGVPIYYPLLENQNWEPDWGFLNSLDYSKVKIIWLNYPHMPTGQKGSADILQEFVELAKRKGILLCHDNPYSFIQNDQPLSIFNVPGAKEVALELNSFSKTFNMAGWRVGWLSGNSSLLEPVIRIKSNMDSGMFKPIQMAATKALSLGQEWYDKLDVIYAERRLLVNQFLLKLNCKIAEGQAGLFVWAKVPKFDADHMCDYLLYKKGIFVTPGHIFGETGSLYIRVSLCMDKQLIQKAIERLV
ncbi:MAG: LL-diaminopimelate aminotransferase [Cyclobacteriaceae bacterium]|jgi:LL-diaminopimelate aminotransferase